VQAVPDPEFLLPPEPTVRGAAGAPQLGRDVLPPASGGEHEPDDPKGDPVPDPRPSTGGTDGLLGREMVSHEVIELIGHL
jgi:hypothetical protein